jgi:uncharacterized protein YjbJ (UPF0337 family)
MLRHSDCIPCGKVSKFPFTRGCIMSGKADEMKGRVKEAAGALAGDRKLKREGKIDQAAGKTKQAAGRAIDKVKNAAKRK